jgi:hypothetical protein
MLLHWHHRFEHLNLISVQQILRAQTILMPKFTYASKCDLLELKCSICEYTKGNWRNTKMSLNSKQVSDLNSTIGASKLLTLNLKLRYQSITLNPGYWEGHLILSVD